MPSLDRLYVTGASGCGVTTLGAALAERLGAVHIDTDDHYWVPSDPPYQVKTEVADRFRTIAAAQRRTGRWVISGTVERWGPELIDDAQLILFLEAPTELRLERLRQRETMRFGDAILPGGALHRTHSEFMAWSAQYEQGTLPGRSRARHEAWLAQARAPVLRLDGSRTVEELVAEALAAGAALDAARPSP